MFVYGSQHNQEIHIAGLKANERVSGRRPTSWTARPLGSATKA